MVAKSQWLFKGLVIYSRYSEIVTLDDIAKAGLEGMRLMDEIPQEARINLIIDSASAVAYPRNISALRQVINISILTRVDWLILISDDYFHKHLARFFAQLFHLRFHTSSSLREAYRFLQEQKAVPPPQYWPADSMETMPHR